MRDGAVRLSSTSLADDQAGMDVDLASAVLAVDRRGVPRPRLAGFAHHPTTLAPQASGFDVAALDAAEHLSVSVEEATAYLAVATARGFWRGYPSRVQSPKSLRCRSSTSGCSR